jgi:DNA-binding MarR family transcriptional regulator
VFYEINSAESRMLATIGAFRVVSERDLHDARDESQDTRRSLRHLEREGLIRTSPLSSDDRAVTLTDRGRNLLEANRYDREDRIHEPRQAFYAGRRKPRELTHDTNVYRAYQRAEERLREQGARVDRVVVDYELKRDYQRFLQEHNRGRKDSDGRPDREPEEIALWARQHDLPYYDEQVHFPDARVEYEDRDGRSRHEEHRGDDGELSRHPRGCRGEIRLHALPLLRLRRWRARRWAAHSRSETRRGAPSVKLAPEPDRWTIELASAQRTEAVASFGFTERQARFLVSVLLHSGVFLERQYCSFAGIVHGQKSTDFIKIKTLVERRFATPITTGKLHRGRMFHVHYKPLWAAIGEPDNRFRKRAAQGRMIERVMLLDTVLEDRDFIWLGLAIDKRRHFIRYLGDRLETRQYPHLLFGDEPGAEGFRGLQVAFVWGRRSSISKPLLLWE